MARIQPSILGCGLLVALVAGYAAPLSAIIPPKKQALSPLAAKAFALPETRVSADPVVLAESRAVAGSAASPFEREKTALSAEAQGEWSMHLDSRTGAPAIWEGTGLPWIPGNANSVTGKSLGLTADQSGNKVPLRVVERLARDYMARHPDLFPAGPDELTVRQGASGPILDYLYFIDFDWYYGGVPVENAHVVFRLNHGNLVQAGQENISASIRGLNATPDLTVDMAWNGLSAHIGGRMPADVVTEAGRLLIQPVSTHDNQFGRGTAYRLVWVIGFHRPGEQGTWEGRVDAHSGEVISFRDTNAYGQSHGGTYAAELFAPEANRPFAYVDCASGAAPFSNSAGVFAGNNCTSNLNGQYVRILDSCGAINLSTSSGDLNFGLSGGYDCTTPGFGGAGNTHATRTQFYNLNLIKEKARTYLPANTWLNAKLTANVNLAGTCNAFWSGTTVNFYPSGGGCGNTGEVMGVSMHEWGHGMDSNDGNAGSPDNGTGETYGDTSAFLQTHQSCVGNGFLGGNCGGYGDKCLACTGVRDTDYAKHGTGKPHFAEDMTSNVCVGCTAYNCTLDATYPGPCGYEGHCESMISSEAVWDLANRDLTTWGLDNNTAWQTLDRYWYASRPTATGAYTCASLTTTAGCGVGNLFTVFRVVDDADGNLTNGTPHATAIFNAFNRHKIACTTVVNTDQPAACPSLASTSVTATPTNNSVVLDWYAVTNATRYFVYRNNLGCDAGFTKIATVTAPTVTYTDNSVVNGVVYYYRIQAAAASDACTGPMSNCDSPAPLNCTPSAAPTGLAVVTAGVGQLNVSWGAVGGATQYKLYRARSLSQPWVEIATVSSAVTSYLDTGLYSGTTYFYTVRAFAGCLSPNATPVSATTTGLCNIPPTFAGLATAVNGLSASCQNNLTWAAGSSNCGGTVTYNVYRSDVANFTPETATPIATGLAGLAYTDTAALFNANYYYAVRAVDSVAGAQDANAVIRASAATGAGTVIQSQNWEAGNTWAAANGTPAATTGAFVRGTPTQQTGNYGMTSQPGSCHGGTQCYFTAVNSSPGVDDIDNGEVMATSPAFNASGGGYPTVGLDMWRWYFNGEPDDQLGDYYVLEVSNNGGTSYTTIETILDDGPSDKKGTNQTDWANVNVRLEAFVPLTTNMRVRMRAAEGPPNAGNGNDPGDLGEAGIDDFTVTGFASCTACTPLAAPTGVTATPNGSNRIDLSWNSVATAVGYQIYRVQGACGSGYTPLAYVTGTSYSDLSVVGSYGYAYVVRSISAGDCPSVNSTCSAATATGVCNIAPTFAGATTVVNPGTASCALTVNWTAATATCPAANLKYNIYRSTSAAFTPSAANRIAACLTGTSFSDTVGVVFDTRYYYTVRAEQDSASGTGPCGGIEDTNTVIRNSTPAGAASTQNVFFDNFDSGLGLRGWSASYFAANATDVRGAQACGPTRSGANTFRWGNSACATNYANSVASFGTPPGNTAYGLRIPESATGSQLSFWHRWQFGTEDGSLLFMQLLPTNTYVSIPASAYTSNPPTFTLPAATTNALGPNWVIWTGTQASLVNTVVNLETVCGLLSAGASCAGKTMNLAFTGSSNNLTNADGWFFDDVQVSANVGASCTTASNCSMIVSVSPALTTSVAAGNDIVFSVSHSTVPNGTYSYQWTRDGVDIPGAILNSYAANEAVASSHTFNVKVSDGVSCTNIQDASSTTGTWTGAPCSNPTGLANNSATDANACTATGNSITWTAPSSWNDAGGTRTWTVLRDTVAVASGPCAGALTEATLNCVDTSAMVGVSYSYTVRANSGCGGTAITTGASATDNQDIAVPVMTTQSLTKAAPDINFSWPSAEASATYTSYSAASANPGTWNSRNVTGTLAWANSADLGDGNSYFYTTTALDACLNESPKQ